LDCNFFRVLKSYIKTEKTKFKIKEKWDSLKLLRDPLHKASTVGTIEESFSIPGVWPLRYKEEAIIHSDLQTYLCSLYGKESESPERVTSPSVPALPGVTNSSNTLIYDVISPTLFDTSTSIVNTSTYNVISPTFPILLDTSASVINKSSYDTTSPSDYTQSQEWFSNNERSLIEINPQKTIVPRLILEKFNQVYSVIEEFDNKLEDLRQDKERRHNQRVRIDLTGGGAVTSETYNEAVEKKKLIRLEKAAKEAQKKLNEKMKDLNDFKFRKQERDNADTIPQIILPYSANSIQIGKVIAYLLAQNYEIGKVVDIKESLLYVIPASVASKNVKESVRKKYSFKQSQEAISISPSCVVCPDVILTSFGTINLNSTHVQQLKQFNLV
jgi:hypothetical protein